MRLLKLAALAAVSGYALVAGTASAQTSPTAPSPQAATADPDNEPDVVVTARRRDERLIDVPISITVASQRTLERLNVTDGDSLSKIDPALVTGLPTNTRANFIPFIRAQGQTSNSGSSARAAVIPYFAEIPYFHATFFDLASIQVLKGPQGTLFGETATGGAVLFTPQKPTNRFEGYASAEVGNYNYYQLEGAINLPLIKDVWSLRIAGQIRKRDGYTKLFFGATGMSPVDADNIDTNALRIISLIRPVDGLEIETILARDNFSLNGTGVVKTGVFDRLPTMRVAPSANAALAARYAYFSGASPVAGQTWLQIEQAALDQQNATGIRTTYANNAQDTISNFQGIANIVTWNITPHLTFKNITGYHRTQTGPNSGLNPEDDVAPVADNFGAICDPGFSPANCRVWGAHNLTEEAQLQANLLNDTLNLQAGGYYREISGAPWAGSTQVVVLGNSGAVVAASCSAFGLPNSPCLTITRTDAKSRAVYGQATFKPVHALELTAGIRNTWDTTYTDSTGAAPIVRTFQGNTINLIPFVPQPLAGATMTRLVVPETSAISYTLAANWHVTDDISVYFTHRRGYKGGGVNRAIPTTDPLYAYSPERLLDIEGGIKGRVDLGDVPLSFSLDGFRGKFSNIQRATFGVVNGAYTGITQNVAAATIQGVEFSFDVKPASFFELSAFAAYTDAHFDNWNEVSTCARQVYRIGCAGVASATVPVYIDHVAGTVTANNVTENVHPDVFAEAPKFRWSIRPVLLLGFLGEGLRSARLSANIQHTSSSTDTDVNYSGGIPSAYIITPGRTTVDLRLDWEHLDWIKQDVGLYFGITNLTNFAGRISSTDLTGTCDCTYSNYAEPRMFYAGFRFGF
jgi:iron complex outermembrane recepter protein